MLGILSVVQVVSAILLILVVLMQQKGAGLGATFGGSSNVYSSKRGLDNILYKTTIVVSIIFFGVSFLQVVL
ncbi:MAG: preprotein translocase subunit SecG [Candidatus Magasanikbacteria bacterium RIFCSPHIGHO2_01_FULL_33_34]|uniref:Protein-export membrane protein SecG n=1 Tax=Candidatus Magasanikbacteria bacterium RIFCSPHIGHO2_01_FULL_33_34 TaxID=1798671 RepID=A0A1F6LKH6_9BACT|nr:MAG: preprotein translocase subunit SecG [Candidatus Magasanikbacteria bacterium RIFCSPHIGHO2_01_FULL_33_34]OGH65658.1 MAG: preprotein translocase subunit SecG [Candidatus Magasanikbacteria bacterium RIFCSPHIGHO2_02_FULL_33_17]OGH75867.1 MAG: preprotein translocase subunit SecG [Candidatus Magasanikbacteria bacterium RIFCSPLOWO2_01_FULL_33_34]OGH81509.1 MAG: preprotein translocase subunit SecG [Candidatus Magasanikbacteria bacterium RIFCSPLOWO2_12_FULL_34_7]